MSEEQSHGKYLARRGLEGTLPWTISIQIRNQTGDLILEWDPQVTLNNWDSMAEIKFSPAYISMDVIPGGG